MCAGLGLSVGKSPRMLPCSDLEDVNQAGKNEKKSRRLGSRSSATSVAASWRKLMV